MSSKAIDHFNFVIDQSERLLLLYEILFDQRKRKIKSDWEDRFKNFMRWPTAKKFVRIDGKRSLIILDQSLNIDMKDFKTDFLDQILRAAVVFIVSSYDRYFHDKIIEKVMSILSRKEDDIPKELLIFDLPVLATKKALEKLKKDPKSRPGNILKGAIQKVLHEDYIFQSVPKIDKAVKFLDIDDYWRKIGREFVPNKDPEEIQKTIREICLRRNQIAHESDLEKKLRGKQPSLRPISHAKVKMYLDFVRKFVIATNQIA